MKRLRDLLIWLAMAAAFGFSLRMLGRALGYASPWFSLEVMLCILGLSAVARPLFRLRLPRGLRDVRDWESRGRVYQALAVPAFGTLLRRTPLRALNSQVYLSGAHNDASEVSTQIEAAEAAHWWAALGLMPGIAYATAQGRVKDLLVLALAQVAMNVYPILHLRWVRGRLQRCSDRRRDRSR